MVIKLRGQSWEVHVARIEGMRNVKINGEKPAKEIPFERRIGGREALSLIIKMSGCLAGFSWHWPKPSGGQFWTRQ